MIWFTKEYGYISTKDQLTLKTNKSKTTNTY